MKALDMLSRSPDFRYTWYYWLEHDNTPSTFWNKLHADMITDISGGRVFENQRTPPVLTGPKALLYIPEKYRFDNRPLVTHVSSTNIHLSFEYDDGWRNVRTNKILMALGVRKMTAENFYEGLRDWLLKTPNGCASKGGPWLSKVAEILRGSTNLRDKLRTLPIVPIENSMASTWVTARTPDIYLGGQAVADIPAFTTIRIVHKGASQYLSVRELYQMLGIKLLDARLVCEKIIDLHDSLNISRNSSRTLKDFVSETNFLFKNWHVAKQFSKENCWMGFKFVQESGYSQDPVVNVVKNGSLLYIATTGGSSETIKKYKGRRESGINVLHPKYFEDICHGDKEVTAEFNHWLKTACGLKSILRITHNGTVVNQVGKYLIENDPVAFLLEVHQHWDHHVRKYGASATCLVKLVSELALPCTDGITRAAKLTAWANQESNPLLEQCPRIAYLDLPDGPDWGKFLPRFGVVTELNATALLRQLRWYYKESKAANPEAIRKLYQTLSSYYLEGIQSVRYVFPICRTVTIPLTRSSDHSSTLATSQCSSRVPRYGGQSAIASGTQTISSSPSLPLLGCTLKPQFFSRYISA
jgi:hypothetical protein